MDMFKLLMLSARRSITTTCGTESQKVCGPEDLWELSWKANPYLHPQVLHSEALGLGPDTCHFNGSIPGASGAGARMQGLLPHSEVLCSEGG